MKIYTKTGDDGTTGLQGGRRISKSDARIVAYGAVDEVNSCIGLMLTEKIDDDISSLLRKIQSELFIAGADLSNPDLQTTKTRVTEEMVKAAELSIDQLEGELEPLTNFILPGGHKVAAMSHLARTIVRRAETAAASLALKENINPECSKYLNRLSDLLFVIARVINKRNGIEDIIWKP